MCNCVERVNEMLAPRNTRLTQPLVFEDRGDNPNLMIKTEVITKKRGAREVGMFASFCPFCGEKYGAKESDHV